MAPTAPPIYMLQSRMQLVKHAASDLGSIITATIQCMRWCKCCMSTAPAQVPFHGDVCAGLSSMRIAYTNLLSAVRTGDGRRGHEGDVLDVVALQSAHAVAVEEARHEAQRVAIPCRMKGLDTELVRRNQQTQLLPRNNDATTSRHVGLDKAVVVAYVIVVAGTAAPQQPWTVPGLGGASGCAGALSAAASPATGLWAAAAPAVVCALAAPGAPFESSSAGQGRTSASSW
jgi:hypothetical protein